MDCDVLPAGTKRSILPSATSPCPRGEAETPGDRVPAREVQQHPTHNMHITAESSSSLPKAQHQPASPSSSPFADLRLPQGFFPPGLIWVSPVPTGSPPAFPFPVPHTRLAAAAPAVCTKPKNKRAGLFPSHTNCRARRLLAGKGS